MKAILDAGALVAIDRRDRAVGARLELLRLQGTSLRTSSAVVAQVWRDGSRQVNLTRLLSGVRIENLDVGVARRIGELLARSRTSDVVDAHVALLAGPDDVIYTSDVGDIRALLHARGVSALAERV